MSASCADPDDKEWDAFVKLASDDDGEAVTSHLRAGRPVYYAESTTPPGLLIKEYPCGCRELVRFDPKGDVVTEVLE